MGGSRGWERRGQETVVGERRPTRLQRRDLPTTDPDSKRLTPPPSLNSYTTRIEADAAKYPVLLSNGNLTASGASPGGRHFAVWTDPFPKPCYLFALVAGDLQVKEDSFKTKSGRDVKLRIYTQPQYIDQVRFLLTLYCRCRVFVWLFGCVVVWFCCRATGRGRVGAFARSAGATNDESRPPLSLSLRQTTTTQTDAGPPQQVGFAMESLKKSMKWDEDVFGLEYDLDLFNIVAVDDFNMGAMENKSLNIFNSRLVRVMTMSAARLCVCVCVCVRARASDCARAARSERLTSLQKQHPLTAPHPKQHPTQTPKRSSRRPTRRLTSTTRASRASSRTSTSTTGRATA